MFSIAALDNGYSLSNLPVSTGALTTHTLNERLHVHPVVKILKDKRKLPMDAISLICAFLPSTFSIFCSKDGKIVGRYTPFGLVKLLHVDPSILHETKRDVVTKLIYAIKQPRLVACGNHDKCTRMLKLFLKLTLVETYQDKDPLEVCKEIKTEMDQCRAMLPGDCNTNLHRAADTAFDFVSLACKERALLMFRNHDSIRLCDHYNLGIEIKQFKFGIWTGKKMIYFPEYTLDQVSDVIHTQWKCSFIAPALKFRHFWDFTGAHAGSDTRTVYKE